MLYYSIGDFFFKKSNIKESLQYLSLKISPVNLFFNELIIIMCGGKVGKHSDFRKIIFMSVLTSHLILRSKKNPSQLK